jgi:hypothetical protein
MPVFNELATIDEIIARVLAVPMRVELIVVDDCSTDGTRNRLTELWRSGCCCAIASQSRKVKEVEKWNK